MNRSRDDAVVAQYDAPDDAVDYADAHRAGPAARFFRARIELVARCLAAIPGGRLLDVGCGPGMVVRELLDARRDDFVITGLDRSAAMVDACRRRAGHGVCGVLGRAEAMPLLDDGFDVVLVMGVLEYTDATAALAEIGRVARPGGLVVVTMLNPANPYRFLQWYLYWPSRRALAALEARVGVPPHRRHPLSESGIRAYREGKLRAMMRTAGLQPQSVTYFDATLLVPPVYRLLRRWERRFPAGGAPRRRRGWHRWLGTAYLVTAHKATGAATGAVLDSGTISVPSSSVDRRMTSR